MQPQLVIVGMSPWEALLVVVLMLAPAWVQLVLQALASQLLAWVTRMVGVVLLLVVLLAWGQPLLELALPLQLPQSPLACPPGRPDHRYQGTPQAHRLQWWDIPCKPGV
jgi:hypothetical protein